MPIIAGQRYPAKVASVGLVQAPTKDTCGIHFRFDCGNDGGIDHTMWITQNTDSLNIAEKTLAALGVPASYLADPGWWAAVRANKPMVGVECEIVTREEEYEGKKHVRVAFINAKRKDAPEGTENYYAKLFSRGGGNSGAMRTNGQSAPPDFPSDAPSDSEVPPPPRRY